MFTEKFIQVTLDKHQKKNMQECYGRNSKTS